MPSSRTIPALPYEVFDLERIVDEAGTLHVANLALRGLSPFDRIGFITGVPEGRSRGGHAHKKQSECIICVQGGVDVHLESQGALAVVPLRQLGRALHLPAGYWRDLVNFSPDAVLALLATGPFDEDDYIRDHGTFVEWESRSS